MSQIWTAPRTPDTVISMNESDRLDQHDDTKYLIWSRFWLGVGGVLAFVIASILLVVAVGGAHAGADYGLVVLIVTLLVVLVDGIMLSRRRNR